MKIIWSRSAVADLQSLRRFIGLDSIDVATRVAVSIVSITEKQLTAFPLTGRIGQVPGTRELVLPRLPYFISYSYSDTEVTVLRVYHTSRLWPV